jgi:hypothetical protein
VIKIAPVLPPAFLQNLATHTAQTFRNAIVGYAAGGMAVGATAPQGGVHPAMGNRMNVIGTAAMSVNVDTGLVYMPCSTAFNGCYAGVNTALYAVPLAAASATQWRQDLICASAQDTALGGSTDNWVIQAITGTLSSSSPGVLPVLPANSIPLAAIQVVPNMTVTNGAGTVVDARVYAPLSGRLFCTSSTRPPLTAPEGTEWWETDTHMPGIIVNGAYQYEHIIPTPPQTVDPWHALPTMQNGWTISAGLPASGYRKRPADPTNVEMCLNIKPGTIADGTLLFTLPATYAGTSGSQYMPISIFPGWGATGGRSDGSTPQVRVTESGAVLCYGLPAFTGGGNYVTTNGSYRCA